MALTTTGIDPSTGRVIPKGSNVLIPASNAGIGDVVLMNSNRAVKIIGWGTYASGSLPSGYVAYGVIYGFVNGMARIVALSEVSRRWTMAASDTGSESATGDTNVSGGYPVAGSTVGSGKNVMRNGIKTTNVGMNLNSLMQNSYTGANTILHPTAAWDASHVMSKANFDALTAGGGNAKDLYGTWENYVRQTLAIRNPGSCFTAHDSDHKVHEQGKWNTYLLGQYTKASPDPNSQGGTPCWYPAANYCYNYYVSGAGETASSHNWWLSSMDELLDLMTDAHWSKVNTCGATTLSNRAHRWSSVRNSATSAWYFNRYGFCNFNSVRYAFTARPVTLLKLV
jgi:hypothetical protein